MAYAHVIYCKPMRHIFFTLFLVSFKIVKNNFSFKTVFPNSSIVYMASATIFILSAMLHSSVQFKVISLTTKSGMFAIFSGMMNKTHHILYISYLNVCITVYPSTEHMQCSKFLLDFVKLS